MAGLYGLVAAAYAVQATLRLRSEETSLRAEAVLATAVSRGRHLAFAALGPAVALAAAGAATGLVHGLNTGVVVAPPV